MGVALLMELRLMDRMVVEGGKTKSSQTKRLALGERRVTSFCAKFLEKREVETDLPSTEVEENCTCTTQSAFPKQLLPVIFSDGDTHTHQKKKKKQRNSLLQCVQNLNEKG